MEKKFDFSSFINETIAMITSPGSRFASMKESGLSESIIKTLLYVALAQIIGIVPMALQGQLSNMGMYWVISGCLLLAAIPILFIAALLLLIISAICSGNTSFKKIVGIAAAVMVIYPLSALMSIFYNINVYFQAILSALVTLYGLYFLYLGLVKALGAKATPSLIIVIILAIFPIYSSGKTVYYKIQGLKLPHEQEAERIEQRLKELKGDLKQKGLIPENYNYAPSE